MTFKSRISQNETLYGVIVTINDTCIGEILAECGFDWLWIDMEHAPFSLKDVQGIAQAVNQRCAPVVRIPVNSEEWITRVLDLGVEGIIVPHVRTAGEAKNIVDASLYPPLGHRSVGANRDRQYGMNANQPSNTRTIFLQIEDKEGVTNIHEIVQVQGVDGIIIGPYDLSGSYDKPGLVDDPEVVEAMDKVLSVCKETGKPIGIFAKDANAAKKYVEKGFQLVAVGMDVKYLWTSAKATVDSLT